MRNPTPIRPGRWLRNAVLLAAVTVACTSAINFREENRRTLQELRVGMDRSEVLDLMGVGEHRQFTGSETRGPVGTGRDTMGVMSVQIPVGGDAPVLYDPHRSEVYEGDDSTWEVLYYYTHVTRDDGLVTEDELTPIVLRDGIVTGWGWTHWAAQNSRHELEAELPDPLPDRGANE